MPNYQVFTEEFASEVRRYYEKERQPSLNSIAKYYSLNSATIKDAIVQAGGTIRPKARLPKQEKFPI